MEVKALKRANSYVVVLNSQGVPINPLNPPPDAFHFMFAAAEAGRVMADNGWTKLDLVNEDTGPEKVLTYPGEKHATQGLRTQEPRPSGQIGEAFKRLIADARGAKGAEKKTLRRDVEAVGNWLIQNGLMSQADVEAALAEEAAPRKRWTL